MRRTARDRSPQIDIKFERFQDAGDADTRAHSGFHEKVELERAGAELVMLGLCPSCAAESFAEIDNTHTIPPHLQERAQKILDEMKAESEE